MTQELALVDVDLETLDTAPCCGITKLAHEGRIQKTCWLRKYLAKGARAKVLLRSDKRQCGYIEYVPGEYAWRGVNAKGYMFLHCVWIFFKNIQHKGYANMMVRACMEDARKAGMDGVAVVTRKGPWMANSDLFLKNGFELADTAAPDYELLVWKINPAAANPSFKGGWDDKLRRYAKGLTIIRADQCPHCIKFSDEIAEAAKTDYGLQPRIVNLRSHLAAQDAPTPYAVFAVIYDGRLLADHPISRTRFHNIMRKMGRPIEA